MPACSKDLIACLVLLVECSYSYCGVKMSVIRREFGIHKVMQFKLGLEVQHSLGRLWDFTQPFGILHWLA